MVHPFRFQGARCFGHSLDGLGHGIRQKQPSIASSQARDLSQLSLLSQPLGRNADLPGNSPQGQQTPGLILLIHFQTPMENQIGRSTPISQHGKYSD
jgi:hypothetical protein